MTAHTSQNSWVNARALWQSIKTSNIKNLDEKTVRRNMHASNPIQLNNKYTQNPGDTGKMHFEKADYKATAKLPFEIAWKSALITTQMINAHCKILFILGVIAIPCIFISRLFFSSVYYLLFIATARSPVKPPATKPSFTSPSTATAIQQISEESAIIPERLSDSPSEKKDTAPTLSIPSTAPIHTSAEKADSSSPIPSYPPPPALLGFSKVLSSTHNTAALSAKHYWTPSISMSGGFNNHRGHLYANVEFYDNVDCIRKRYLKEIQHLIAKHLVTLDPKIDRTNITYYLATAKMMSSNGGRQEDVFQYSPMILSKDSDSDDYNLHSIEQPTFPKEFRHKSLFINTAAPALASYVSDNSSLSPNTETVKFYDPAKLLIKNEPHFTEQTYKIYNILNHNQEIDSLPNARRYLITISC